MAMHLHFARVPMRIRLGYTIELDISTPMAVVTVLNVHPSRVPDLLEPDELQIFPEVPAEKFTDPFGNLCVRFVAGQGTVRLSNSTLIEDSGEPDPIPAAAPQIPIDQLPPDTVQFLLASRYCEVDELSGLAWQLFGNTPEGWPRVQAILDWVHSEVTYCTISRGIHQDRRPCLAGEARRVSRLSASRDHALPRHAHSGAVCHRLSRRYSDSTRPMPDGLQRMV